VDHAAHEVNIQKKLHTFCTETVYHNAVKYIYVILNYLKRREAVKNKVLKLFVLLAIFFNIAHATVIASEEHCAHESVHEYIQEIEQPTECDDLCHFHHLFHFSAIITPAIQCLPAAQYKEQPDTKLLAYHPPFGKTENKPPIA